MRWSWAAAGGQIVPPKIWTTLNYIEGDRIEPVQRGGASFDAHFLIRTPSGTDPITKKSYAQPLPDVGDMRRPVRMRARIVRFVPISSAYPEGIDPTHWIPLPIETWGETWAGSLVADRFMVPGIGYGIQLYWNGAKPEPSPPWPLTIAPYSTLIVRQYESTAAGEADTYHEP